MPAESQSQPPPVGQTGCSLPNCLLALIWTAFGVAGITLTIVRVIDGARESRAPDSVRAVLASQEIAWNTGDLDGFMAGYWKSDDLKFLSGDDVTTGWQATHDRYQKRYKGEGKEMGKLTFTVLDVDVVSGDAAIVRGRWAVVTSDGSTPHGLFTLLFRRVDGQWVIVSDHTSAAEKK